MVQLILRMLAVTVVLWATAACGAPLPPAPTISDLPTATMVASLGAPTGVPRATAAAPTVATPPATAATTLPELAVATTNGGVHVAAADGSSGREVAAGVCRASGNEQLALSPTGRHLALACSPTQGNALATLFLIELGPDTVQRLVAEVSDAHQSLAWSPDGRYMAYQVAVTVGDAPVSGQALWMHDIATGRQTQLDEARLFDFQPVWTLDNSAVVYVVGSWQHSTGPVVTYRAPLDGSGGVPWLPDVQALVPGPAGQWLSVREPRDRAGRGQVLLIVADGSVRPLALPLVEEEYPLGWLDGEPVVWLRTVTSLTSSLVLGEVWLAGAHPRRLLTDVPYGQTGAIAGERLLYAEQVDDPNLARPVWLADLMTSQKQQLGIQGRTPVAVRPARSLAAPAPGLPSTGAGGSQPEQARP